MMMRVGKFLVAVLALSLMASSAFAAFTATWTQVAAGNGVGAPAYPVAASTNDPALLTMQTWDLNITYDSTTAVWAQAGMEIGLSAGTFYQNALGGATRPNPGFVGAFPALAYTTFVSSTADNGTNNATTLVGRFSGSGAFSNGSSGSGTPGTFNGVWGQLGFPTGPGTYNIARVTFPLTSIANVVFGDPGGSYTSLTDNSYTLIPTIGGGGPVTTPEPATLGLLAIAGVFGLRRRA
jgi:hypothetical protein